MVFWADADRARAWERLSPAEQEAAEEPLHAWYEANSAAGRIQSGEELAWPRDRITIAAAEGGPLVEHAPESSPSVLSGVMAVEVESTEAAVEMARSWPDLRAPGDRIDLIPIRNYDET